jgi:hypothetical protein
MTAPGAATGAPMPGAARVVTPAMPGGATAANRPATAAPAAPSSHAVGSAHASASAHAAATASAPASIRGAAGAPAAASAVASVRGVAATPTATSVHAAVAAPPAGSASALAAAAAAARVASTARGADGGNVHRPAAGPAAGLVGGATATVARSADAAAPVEPSAAHRSNASTAHVATTSARPGSAAAPDSTKVQRPSPKPIVIEHFTPESLMPELAVRRPPTNTAQSPAAAPRAQGAPSNDASSYTVWASSAPSSAAASHAATPNTTSSHATPTNGDVPGDASSYAASTDATAADMAWAEITSSPTAEPESVVLDGVDQEPSVPRVLLPVTVGAIVVLALAVVGVFILRSGTNSTPPVVESYQDAPLPASSDSPPPSGVDEPAALPVSTTSAITQPLETTSRSSAPQRVAPSGATQPSSMPTRSMPPSAAQPSAPTVASTTQIHEEMPEVPSRVLHTIHGHVRVSVRLIVDKEGAVFAALVDEPGPSRYFERLAIDAAKKWTFPPLDTTASRLELVRFEFTRQGTTGRAMEVE